MRARDCEFFTRMMRCVIFVTECSTSRTIESSDVEMCIDFADFMLAL